MRLAAIDVGTNSVHMVIADVHSDRTMAVADRIKETVRLGRGVFVTGRLAREPMDLAVRALANFERLAAMRRVERIGAVATSAVREADNRAAFIRRVRRETGIRVRVISGAEEARLVFLAARQAMGLEGSPCLVVDVGGGSVELVLARDGKPLWMESLRLGVSRLSERFLCHDPPLAREVRDLKRHLRDATGDLLLDARRRGVARAIGTSGTINALVALAWAARGEKLASLHGAAASAAEVAQLRRRVLESALAKRLQLPGIEPGRADLMPAAALIADHVLRYSGARELVACGYALREGLLLKLAGASGRAAGETAGRAASAESRFQG